MTQTHGLACVTQIFITAEGYAPSIAADGNREVAVLFFDRPIMIGQGGAAYSAPCTKVSDWPERICNASNHGAAMMEGGSGPHRYAVLLIQCWVYNTSREGGRLTGDSQV